MEILLNIAIVVCLFVSLVLGVITLVRSTAKLYWVLLNLAASTIFIGRIFHLYQLVNGHDVTFYMADGLMLLFSSFFLALVIVQSKKVNKSKELVGQISNLQIQNKSLQKELERREQRYRLAESYLEEGIWEWDRKEEEVKLSLQWKDMLGFSGTSQTIPDNEVEALFDVQHKAIFKQLLKDGMMSGESFDFHLKLNTKKGKPMWVQVAGQVVPSNRGDYDRVLGTVKDITEIKSIEQFEEIDVALRKSLSDGIAFDKILELLIDYLENAMNDMAISIMYHDPYEDSKCRIVAPRLSDSNLNDLKKKYLVQDTFLALSRELLGSEIHRGNPQGTQTHQKSLEVLDGSGNRVGVMDIFSNSVNSSIHSYNRLLTDAVHLSSVLISRFRDEQNLFEVQSLFQTIFEQAAVGVAVVDSESGRFLQTNLKLAQMLGYKPSELSELSLVDLASNLVLEGDAIFNLEDEYNAEFRFTKRDGQEIWAEINASPMWGNVSESMTHIIVVQDITSRKDSEESLRFHSEILEHMEECVFISRCSDLQVVYANSKFEELFGYSKDEIVGKSTSSLVSPEYVQGYESTLRDMKMDKDDSRKIGEIKSLRKDGSTFLRKENVTTYEHQKFGMTWVSICEDITLIREAEGTMHKMEKLQSLGTLAGGIAHDFNNILLGVFANISIVKHKLSSNDASFEYVEEALTAMRRAQALTGQLLTFAKGGNPIKEDASIDQIVEEVVKFDLVGSKIKPIIKRVRNLWLTEVDRGQMQQVFSNLTINAKEAMKGGGNLMVTINNDKVELDNVMGLPPGPYVLIVFKDQGGGISKENLSRIFDPYFTTKDQGNGLGLATSFSIIKRHGGHVIVDSMIGKGTVFNIWIPATTSKKDLSASESLLPKEMDGSSYKILVMDDEPVIQKAVNHMLKEHGHEVMMSSDGKQALELYDEALASGDPFDLLIADLTVPGGMGGVELVEHIKLREVPVKVIASSGYAEGLAQDEYYRQGFSDILPKPYNMKELIDKIDHVMTSTSV